MIWWMLLKTSSKTFPYIKWGRVVWTQIDKHFKTFNCDWEELKNCETYWKSFYYHQSNHTGKKKTTPPSGPTWRRRTRRSWLWGRRGWRSWCWRRTRSAAASAPAYLPGIAPAILMRFGFSMLDRYFQGSGSNMLTTFQFVDVAWISEKYFVVGLVFADTGSDAIMLSCWCTVHFITSSWYNHHCKS